MSESTLTVKFQTTVPKEIRKSLGARPGDRLHWEVVGDYVRVKAGKPEFLALQGTFQVDPGNPVEDVHQVRELLGSEDR